MSLQFPNGPRFRGWDEPAKDVLKQLNRENKNIIIYGCGNRCLPLAKILQYEHIDFYGFCDRLAEKYPDGVLEKPVISPDELVAHGDEYYVLPAAYLKRYLTEIYEFLGVHGYPQDHILDWTDGLKFIPDERPYFEFPGLYRKGTAFIDGGCYDCEGSY